MDEKRPRKLDLNAPFMSARRFVAFTDAYNKSGKQLQGALGDTSYRIPFSWEQAPGKPKESKRSNNKIELDAPRPMLPPNRSWHQNKAAAAERNNTDDRRMLEDGCHGDGEDCSADFFDSMEMSSLTEAIDMVEKEEKEGHGLYAHNLEMIESGESQSPNYIIRRFLLDAEALAASSAVTLSKNLNNEHRDCGNYSSGTNLVSSSRGCGFEIFFPWRMKHKLRGVNNSHSHQSNAKHKKKVT